MIRAGIHAVVLLGTVGENTTLGYDENLALWEQARELYRWHAPVLHLVTKVKFVQYIKQTMQEARFGSELTRAPRLPLVGAGREETVAIIGRAIQTRPALPMAFAR